MALLEVRKLTMRFGGLVAVNQVDLVVEPGQIFSVIGPNGAGKTTVFNAITGIYPPTEGTIEFQGRELMRPLTRRVIAGCVLVALLTGIAAVLVSVNVDRLWRAAIRRNYIDTTQPFQWTAALRDAGRYFRGGLALERTRSGRWSLVSADGKDALGFYATQADAESARALYEEAIRRVASGAGPSEIVAEAREKHATLARIAREQRAMGFTVWIAFLLGAPLGGAAAFAVWKRARRTPDVIARGGIARTFQNIRLFQAMTVMENVLIGMDRSYRAFVPRMMVRTPGLRREEEEGERRALELLAFVGLDTRANMLSRNLPYGDQRRLEIARALATKPRLLLLDEPAAGMNPAESVDLMNLIRRIRDTGVTVLLIEHHMKVVMGISDRIAVLEYGTKIAEGTPEEVRTDPKVIEAYLGKEEIS